MEYQQGATSPSYYYGSSFTHNESSNVTLYAVWELNGTRFTLDESSKKVTVYNITYCQGDTCTYDRKNGLDASGTVSKSKLYTNASLEDKYKSINNGYIPNYYFKNETFSCYCGSSTSSKKKDSFPWCDDWMVAYNNDYNGEGGPNYIAVWPTTKSGWYYSRTYDCFVQDSGFEGSYNINELPTSTTVAPALSECPIVPSCTITSVSVASSSVTKYKLTITASDYSGKFASSPFSWDNSTWTSSNTKTVTPLKTTTYTAYVKDAAGHIGSCSVTVTISNSGLIER